MTCDTEFAMYFTVSQIACVLQSQACQQTSPVLLSRMITCWLSCLQVTAVQDSNTGSNAVSEEQSHDVSAAKAAFAAGANNVKSGSAN